MADYKLTDRLAHAWSALTRAPTEQPRYDMGMAYSYRPDRRRLTHGNERSIVTSIYNRIAMDVAAVDIKHVRLDENDRFLDEIDSGLDNVLTLDANLDQTGRAFIQDIVMSMFDEVLLLCFQQKQVSRQMKQEHSIFYLCVQQRLLLGFLSMLGFAFIMRKQESSRR